MLDAPIEDEELEDVHAVKVRHAAAAAGAASPVEEGAGGDEEWDGEADPVEDELVDDGPRVADEEDLGESYD